MTLSFAIWLPNGNHVYTWVKDCIGAISAEIPSKCSWDMTINLRLEMNLSSQWAWPPKFNQIIPTSTCFSQVWHSVKLFVRYGIHKKGIDKPNIKNASGCMYYQQGFLQPSQTKHHLELNKWLPHFKTAEKKSLFQNTDPKRTITKWLSREIKWVYA